MYQNKNYSLINKIPSYHNFKKNYLTESSCEEIQKVLRKDYFNRLQKASLNNHVNYINEDEIPPQNNENLEENKKYLKNAAKQILFSDKIRKKNYSWIKNHRRKKNYNETDIIKMDLLKNEDYKTLVNENNNNDRKNNMFKAKKIYKDKFPIFYDYHYIDEVENKYIKPYLSKENVIYKDYIENKKSKTPFNFIIG